MSAPELTHYDVMITNKILCFLSQLGTDVSLGLFMSIINYPYLLQLSDANILNNHQSYVGIHTSGVYKQPGSIS